VVRDAVSQHRIGERLDDAEVALAATYLGGPKLPTEASSRFGCGVLKGAGRIATISIEKRPRKATEARQIFGDKATSFHACCQAYRLQDDARARSGFGVAHSVRGQTILSYKATAAPAGAMKKEASIFGRTTKVFLASMHPSLA
jgi:hypothetical protein